MSHSYILCHRGKIETSAVDAIAGTLGPENIGDAWRSDDTLLVWTADGFCRAPKSFGS